MDSKNMFYMLLSRYVTYIGVFITSIIITGGELNTVVFSSLLFILVLLNSSVRLKKFKEKPLLFIISILIEIIIIVYMQQKLNPIAFVYLYIIAVDVYLMLKLRYALYMSIPIYIGIILCLLPQGSSVNPKSLLTSFTINVAIMTFFSGAAYVIRMELKMRKEIQSLYRELKNSRDELEEANKKLTEYARKIEDVTVLNERNRLAGEIHDTIGHSFTALIMEIDICGKLIDKDVDKTKNELKKASELARNALSEVRRSVKAIKPLNMKGMSGIHAIEELIRDFEKNTRIIVKFNVSKQQYRLSPTIEATLYRSVQESLTNCAKHGHADNVEIDLLFKEGSVELNIRDNGNGCGQFVKGVGLTTMEERVRSLGGRVDISGDNGFKTNVVIPVEVV